MGYRFTLNFAASSSKINKNNPSRRSLSDFFIKIPIIQLRPVNLKKIIRTKYARYAVRMKSFHHNLKGLKAVNFNYKKTTSFRGGFLIILKLIF